MPNNFIRREIGKEIFFNCITDKRFKRNTIAINIFSPLSEETASEIAVAARIILKCSSDYPTYAELCSKLSSLYSAQLSGGAMHFGDAQLTTFAIDYIDNKYALQNEKIDEEALEILLGCLFNPLIENGGFSEKFTALEKKSLIENIESELNDKQYYASVKADEIIYKNEPAALRGEGTAETAKRVTAKSSYNAYQRLLRHGRIEIFCSGSGDFENIKKKITEKFVGLKREDIYPYLTKRSPIKPQPETVTEKLDVEQSKLVMAFKTDMDDVSAFGLLSEIYGGSPVSKLFMNVREKLSLCYGCWSGFSKTKGTLTVTCGVEKENIERTKEEILRQLEQMQKGDFSDEDLNSAKMYCSNGFKAFNDSESAIAVWYLLRIYYDDIITPEEAAQREERFTKEDIVKAARSLKLDTVYVLTSKDQ